MPPRSDTKDPAAWFERQVVALLPDLYGAAVRLTKHEADAEDLVAAAVARAWSRLDDLRDPERFRGWVFRILGNAFTSHCRAREARGSVVSLDEEADGPERAFSLFERLHPPFLLWWGDPEQRFLDRLLREDLERAIDALPEGFRVTVVLADLQGFSYQEIAEITEVPIGTVRSRLARGRARLQEALWKHAEDRGLTPAPKGHEQPAPGHDHGHARGRIKGTTTP
ncbi:MAG: sigma-70 family RNA polymerase sigma factor [Gemmatimonadota bacterium]